MAKKALPTIEARVLCDFYPAGVKVPAGSIVVCTKDQLCADLDADPEAVKFAKAGGAKLVSIVVDASQGGAKPELEAAIAELESRLAAADEADKAALQAELEARKAELEALG